MAIKERKQITGTTAQIDAYAGHEGQIVWDKEKKNFVGMSGIAGKNYPLASQTYVDNEVAKCLPLTGGEMLGSIGFQGKAYLTYEFPSHTVEQCALSFVDPKTKNNLGGFIALRGHKGSSEIDRGSFILGARSGDGSISRFLFGDVAGNLSWDGHPIQRITGIGDGWVRFNTKIQICFGYTHTTADNFATVGYGAPFSHDPIIITSINGDYTTRGVYTCYAQTNNTFFHAYSLLNGVPAPGIGVRWFAIGYY